MGQASSAKGSAMAGDFERDTANQPLHHSRNHEEQILWEQVKQLYGLAPLGFIATLMNSLIAFFVMKDVLPYSIIVPWLAAILAVTALRGGLVLWFRRAQPEAAAASIWKTRFLAGLVLIGLAWGAIGFVPFSFSLAHQVFLAFVLGGMAAGASSTFSKVKYGDAFFTIPSLMPFTMHFFLTGDPFHDAMGAMILLYIVLLSRIARNNFSINRTSLLLRFENQEMIQGLKRANEAVEALNSQLLAEIGAKLGAEAQLRAHHEQLERMVEQRTEELVRANEQLKSEIEERKEIETALRESRERLVLAQRAGRVGVFDWDMTANQLIWTTELEELFGLKPGEFERDYQGWASRVHPDDLPDLEAKFRKWTEDRAGFVDFEYRLPRTCGDIRWIAASASFSYREDGTPLRMVGTNVDVTEMKEAQEKLLAAKDAAEAGSMAKTEFLANMSHEMRTPLAGVLGMIKLVLDMEIGTEERQLLEMAKRSADSLLRIIADVLDFSRLEAGVLRFERKPFSFREALKAAIEVVSFSARERGLQLSWKAEDDLPEQIEGDAGRLRQVLVNLLGNAVKFTDKGGIEVTVRPSSSPETPDRRFLLFSVKDTGVGIPPDQLERIFGKFTQVDASLTKRYGGTGLGLALSRQIVESMGGRIWAESTPGVGSTFHFTIPEHP